MKNVLIVEDDESAGRAYAMVASRSAELQVVAVVGTVAAAIQSLNSQSIDICLVDLGLPDGSGLEVIRYATNRPIPAHCLVITVFGDELSITSAIEAGAGGYILKDSLTMSLASDIASLLAGGSPLSPRVARTMLKRFRDLQPTKVPEAELVSLSKRESEVLGLIAKGCSYSEVGSALSISSVTVATHLNNIYQKLSVHSRSEAVYEAHRLGLISF